MTARLLFTRSFLLAVGLLAVSELVARVFFSSNVEGRFEYGYHPTAGFTEGADGVLELRRSGGRRFFPQTYPVKRPDHTYRIMVIGDSVARGRSLRASYGGKLEERLRSKGLECEVWNLCVPGYGAERIQLVLKQGLRYDPSLVVFHLNNSNEYEDDREKKRSLEFQGPHPRNWLMKSFLLRRLYEAKTEQLAWKYLTEPMRSMSSSGDADAEVAAGMNPLKLKAWQQRVEETTAESLRLCRQAGVPVILVTQANAKKGTDGKHHLIDAGLDPLAGSLTNRNVVHVSMATALKNHSLAEIYADTSHLLESGHALMATALLEAVERGQLLEMRSADRR